MKLECDGIGFGYNGIPLLTSVYLKVETGTIVGLLGRNGSGKSTLMKACFGSLRPWSSSIRIDNQSIPFPAFASRKLVYLPQDSFLPMATLRSILKLFKVEKTALTEDFPEFEDCLDFFPLELSGGQLRLFEVLLILKKPGAHFCFLDEPFTGLSPVVVERLQATLLKEKANKGILVSDHLYRQVLQIADAMMLLTGGRTFVVKNEEDLARQGYIMM